MTSLFKTKDGLWEHGFGKMKTVYVYKIILKDKPNADKCDYELLYIQQQSQIICCVQYQALHYVENSSTHSSSLHQ